MKTIITILLLSLPGLVYAEKIADAPYIPMAAIVGTMAVCAVGPPDDQPDKGSHCFVGMSASFLGTILASNTDQRWWAGAALGCGLGAAKEIYDNNNNGTVEFADFAWTCLPAITTNFGLNGMIKFYSNKGTPSVGISVDF